MATDLADEAVATDNDFLDREDVDSLDFSDLAPARFVDDDTIETQEGFWHAFDGERLFWQAWEPEGGPSRGAVALMHGYGEHSSRYEHVAAACCRAGYGVLAMDARGHGRSTGKRGHVNHYDDYVLDYDLLKMHTADRWPDVSLFCMGHSNGGQIVLRYALRHPDDVTGFVISSPMCGLSMEVPPAKALAGKIMNRVWPSFSIPSGLDPKGVSRIDRVVQKYIDDPLVFDTTTAGWFQEALAAMEETLDRAPELDQPFLFVVAGDDKLVDPRATEELFHRMSSGERELELYPDLYHEVLNETEWDEIARRIIDWMEKERGRET